MQSNAGQLLPEEGMEERQGLESEQSTQLLIMFLRWLMGLQVHRLIVQLWITSSHEVSYKFIYSLTCIRNTNQNIIIVKIYHLGNGKGPFLLWTHMS